MQRPSRRLRLMALAGIGVLWAAYAQAQPGPQPAPSPWQQNGPNIWYPNGCVLLGTTLPSCVGNEIVTAPSTTTAAGLNLPPGTAPISPVNGDLWATSSGFYGRVNGETVGPFGAGGGGVSSVGLALPSSLFSVTGSPVTGDGTLTGSLINQDANTFFAGPSSGSATVPGFRALVLDDLPQLNAYSLWANPTGSAAVAEQVTLGATLNWSGTTLNCTSFGSANAGCVPQSGGGATNFLRADGTWAAAGAAPGGSNTDVQFNSGSGFGGDSGLTYAGSGGALNLQPAANIATPFLISGGSTTGSGTSRLGLSVTGTLNTTGSVAGAAFYANITCTSCGNANLFELDVGGSEKFKIDTNGYLYAPGSLNGVTGIGSGSNFGGANGFIYGQGGSGFLQLGGNGNLGGLQFSSDYSGTNTINGSEIISWAPNAEAAPLSPDTFIGKLATSAGGAGFIIAGGILNNGTNYAATGLSLVNSLSTGNATNPDMNFYTGVKTVSGATLATPTLALTLKGETQQAIFAGPIKVTALQSGTAATYACFDSSGNLISSSSAC